MKSVLFVQACPGAVARVPNALASCFIAELQLRDPEIVVDTVDLRAAMRGPGEPPGGEQAGSLLELFLGAGGFVFVVPDLEAESAACLRRWLGLLLHATGGGVSGAGSGRRTPLAGKTAVVVPGRGGCPVSAAEGGGEGEMTPAAAREEGGEPPPPVLALLGELGVGDCRCLPVADGPVTELEAGAGAGAEAMQRARELARSFPVPGVGERVL